MSGSKLLAFPENPSPRSLLETLRIEDDRRLSACVGSFSLLAAPWVAWALTVQIAFPPPILDGDPEGTHGIFCDFGEHFTALPPPDYHAKLHPPRIVKHHAKPGEAGHRAPKPKTAHPEAGEPGRLAVKPIGSRKDRAGLTAYDLLPGSVKSIDLDKLTELPMLTRTGATRIAGRRGMESHEFNVEYSEEGTGCGAKCDPSALPGLPPPAPHGARLPPTASGPRISSIDYADEANTRSSASILAIIRSHAPGLRHVYNGYLKQAPGMSGKLELRFSIAPGGDVIELAVASSTTGAPDFDAEIARQVKTWRFDPVRGPGNDRVTVPFTFSE